MASINLKLNGDGAFPELKGKKIHHVKSPIDIALLKGGMKSGKHSVVIKVELENGEIVFIETSATLFMSTAVGIKARIELDEMKDKMH